MTFHDGPKNSLNSLYTKDDEPERGRHLGVAGDSLKVMWLRNMASRGKMCLNMESSEGRGHNATGLGEGR